MANNKNTLLDIAQEIERYSKDIARELAIKTREELYKSANKAINYFYADYTPIYYHRHLPVTSNIKRSFRKYYANPHNTIFSGGIEMSSGWMNDVYRADTDYIATLVYSGYHGNVLMLPQPITNVPPITHPSPIMRILNTRDKIQSNISGIANGISKKVRATNGYKYIK